MAEVDNVRLKRPTGSVGMVVGNCQLTGATSTLGQATHQFNNTIFAAILRVRGTAAMTNTISGTTITITGTNGNVVDFVIWGD